VLQGSSSYYSHKAMAGEQPKKITGGAFGRYMAENRAALFKELPGQAATATVKLGSQRFKALGDVARAKYQKMYEAAKQKYEKDMAAFLAAGGVPKARKSKKDKKEKKSKDPNKPKKPAGGAFGCFLAKKRAEFMKECAGKPITAVTKLASERWKQVSEVEKRPFQKEFEEKQAQFKKAMETYVPPVVEEEEDEDEEDAEDEDEEEAEEDEEEDSPKKRKAASKTEAPAAKKAKTASSAEVDAEAKKLGFLAKLKSISENEKFWSSPADFLAELQKQNGSVVAAKKALLGA